MKTYFQHFFAVQHKPRSHFVNDLAMRLYYADENARVASNRVVIALFLGVGLGICFTTIVSYSFQ